MDVIERLNNLLLITNGGDGSGNFGHVGRPGLQGGSASTGKQQGLTISKSYSSEVSSIANQTLEKMQSEYGVKLSSVKLCSNNEWKELAGDDLRKTKTLGMSCAGESEDTHEAFIILNDKYHMNEKVKSKPKSFEPPQFNADKSTEGVLRHEMLHCMFGVLGIKKCIKETDNEEKAIEYIRKLEEDVLNKIKKETKKSFPEVPYPDKKSDFFTNGRYISSYAETSTSEYLAEIASNPSYSEFTKKANAILQKELQALAKEQSLFTNNSKKKYKILIFSEGYPASKTNKKKTKNIEERIDNLLLVVNGGKGSGNFGHAGRLGLVGGSASDKLNSGIKWGGDTPYGSKNFQKSVEKISKELENQYGISLSHTRILKQKVFTSYYNSSFSGCTGKCKVDGTGQIDIAIADWEAEKEDVSSKSKNVKFFNTDTSVEGTIRHEMGHAITGELSQHIVKNSSKSGGIEHTIWEQRDAAVKEVYNYINSSLARVAEKTAKANGLTMSTRVKKEDSEKYRAMSEYGIKGGDKEIVAESIANPNYSVVAKTVTEHLKKIVKLAQENNYDDVSDFYRDANKIILNSTNVSKSFDLCIGYTRNREDLERLLNN